MPGSLCSGANAFLLFFSLQWGEGGFSARSDVIRLGESRGRASEADLFAELRERNAVLEREKSQLEARVDDLCSEVEILENELGSDAHHLQRFPKENSGFRCSSGNFQTEQNLREENEALRLELQEERGRQEQQRRRSVDEMRNLEIDHLAKERLLSTASEALEALDAERERRQEVLLQLQGSRNVLRQYIQGFRKKAQRSSLSWTFAWWRREVAWATSSAMSRTTSMHHRLQPREVEDLHQRIADLEDCNQGLQEQLQRMKEENEELLRHGAKASSLGRSSVTSSRVPEGSEVGTASVSTGSCRAGGDLWQQLRKAVRRDQEASSLDADNDTGASARMHDLENRIEILRDELQQSRAAAASFAAAEAAIRTDLEEEARSRIEEAERNTRTVAGLRGNAAKEAEACVQLIEQLAVARREDEAVREIAAEATLQAGKSVEECTVAVAAAGAAKEAENEALACAEAHAAELLEVRTEASSRAAAASAALGGMRRASRARAEAQANDLQELESLRRIAAGSEESLAAARGELAEKGEALACAEAHNAELREAQTEASSRAATASAALGGMRRASRAHAEAQASSLQELESLRYVAAVAEGSLAAARGELAAARSKQPLWESEERLEHACRGWQEAEASHVALQAQLHATRSSCRADTARLVAELEQERIQRLSTAAALHVATQELLEEADTGLMAEKQELLVERLEQACDVTRSEMESARRDSITLTTELEASREVATLAFNEANARSAQRDFLDKEAPVAADATAAVTELREELEATRLRLREAEEDCDAQQLQMKQLAAALLMAREEAAERSIAEQPGARDVEGELRKEAEELREVASSLRTHNAELTEAMEGLLEAQDDLIEQEEYTVAEEGGEEEDEKEEEEDEDEEKNGAAEGDVGLSSEPSVRWRAFPRLSTESAATTHTGSPCAMTTDGASDGLPEVPISSLDFGLSKGERASSSSSEGSQPEEEAPIGAPSGIRLDEPEPGPLADGWWAKLRTAHVSHKIIQGRAQEPMEAPPEPGLGVDAMSLMTRTQMGNDDMVGFQHNSYYASTVVEDNNPKDCDGDGSGFSGGGRRSYIHPPPQGRRSRLRETPNGRCAEFVSEAQALNGQRHTMVMATVAEAAAERSSAAASALRLPVPAVRLARGIMRPRTTTTTMPESESGDDNDGTVRATTRTGGSEGRAHTHSAEALFSPRQARASIRKDHRSEYRDRGHAQRRRLPVEVSESETSSSEDVDKAFVPPSRQTKTVIRGRKSYLHHPGSPRR